MCDSGHTPIVAQSASSAPLKMKSSEIIVRGRESVFTHSGPIAALKDLRSQGRLITVLGV